MGNTQGQEAGGMGKLMVMLPLMMLSNKIDFEDETILFYCRCAYGSMVVAILVSSLMIKSKVVAANDERAIYIEPPKVPFGPQEPQARTKTTYKEHEAAQAQSLINNSLVGACIMSFIHFKMEVNQVLVLQAVMLPLTHMEHALVKKYLLGKTEERVWGEVLDGEEGVPVVQSEEDVAINEAWNAGKDVNFAPLLAVLKDINHQTTPDGWTALMVACGAPVDVSAVMRKLLKLGARPELTDAEGWTALHWAAFHGRPEAAQQLLDLCVDEEGLAAVRDKEGKTALEIARAEKNAEVVAVLTGAASEEPAVAPPAEEAEGLHHRNAHDVDVD